jgi:hypothetical protein
MVIGYIDLDGMEMYYTIIVGSVERGPPWGLFRYKYLIVLRTSVRQYYYCLLFIVVRVLLLRTI